MTGHDGMPTEPRRARGRASRTAFTGAVVLMLTGASITGPLVVGVAEAAPATDVAEPEPDTEAPTSDPATTDPPATDAPTTDVSTTTDVGEADGDGATPADEDDGIDTADAISWIAVVAAVALLGTAAWWMVRRPEEDRLPPSDADWPTDAEIP